MANSTDSLPFRSRILDEGKQQRGTSKHPDRHTRRNEAHAVAKLSEDFDSALTSGALYHSNGVGDKTLPHHHDPSCSPGESVTSPNSSLHSALKSRPRSVPSLSADNTLPRGELINIHEIEIGVTILLNGVQIGAEKTFGAGECTTLPRFKGIVMQQFGAQFRLFELSSDTLFDGLNLFGPCLKSWSPGVTSNSLYDNWFNSEVRTAPPGAACNVQVMLVEKEDADAEEEEWRPYLFNEKQRALRNPARGINGVAKFFEEFSNQGAAVEEDHWKKHRKYEAAYHRMKALHIIDSDGSDAEDDQEVTRKDGRRAYGGLRVPGY